MAAATPTLTLLPAAARTTAGQGDALDLTTLAGPDGPVALRLQLNVTALSGSATPTLTVLVEDSVDGGVSWNTVGTFTAVTAAGRQVINVGPRGDAQPAGFAWPFYPRKVRVRWTLSGTTPSFTFDVKGVALEV